MNLEELLKDLNKKGIIDNDIIEVLMSDSNCQGYKVWGILNDPIMTALKWQELKNVSTN